MIPILICAAIGFFLGAVIGSADEGDAIDIIISGIAAALFGAGIGFVMAMIIGTFVYSDIEVVDRTTRLESLVDGGTELYGSFFLGSGIINDVNTFTWYEQAHANAYVQREAPASQSVVHFDNGQPYYVVHVRRYKDGSFIGFWGVRIDAGDELGRSYDFYVPRGTIQHNFELDAK